MRWRMKRKTRRDVEKGYPKREFIKKLRRVADALERGERMSIQVAGERISIPAGALFNIEHEREGDLEEVEFQFKWRRERKSKRRSYSCR
jgi:amphi-Trp domain-containing protein